MNYLTIAILLSLLDEIPELPEHARANRRANREKTIRHNRRIYTDIVGGKIWFDEPDVDGKYIRYTGGHVVAKPQQGRWETNYFKTRSFIDTGRVHSGDKHRKGKRAHKGQHTMKLRARQLLADYEQYGE